MAATVDTRKTTGPVDATRTVVPTRLAHIVLQTTRYAEMVNWYKALLGADISFANEMLTFLSYDDEHHRIAIGNLPGLTERNPGAAGLHHVAFTYATLADLLSNYLRLKAIDIVPRVSMNHGPTTSLYYFDPDGNRVELQVDNFDTLEAGSAYFYSDEFAENPVGVLVDPLELISRLQAGESEEVLKLRPRTDPQAAAAAALSALS